MNYRTIILIALFFISSAACATEFTISSYNCGGLSDHYDYLRAVTAQKIMQERYVAEPQEMWLNERAQSLAIKILFSLDKKERLLAQQEWEQGDYLDRTQHLIASSRKQEPNALWNQKMEEAITSYKIRPVVIHDNEVNEMLKQHLNDMTSGKEIDSSDLLQEARTKMAKRIFAHHLKYDIICLQEANYLNCSLFPEHYEILFSEASHSLNGIAWNKDRFDLIEVIGDIHERAFAVHLLDKETNKTVVVASGHITGCNPYHIENDPITGMSDSSKGDAEVQTIVELFDTFKADIKLIGMDSNVTSLHPRLNILKEASYRIDGENYNEPTCTNPNLVLNTRIDWIAVKSNDTTQASVINIPVMNVGLNSIQTNISDHKPIAAKINYE